MFGSGSMSSNTRASQRLNREIEKAQTRFEAANLLYEQGNWKEAIRVARPLIKRWPRFQMSYVVIAASYFRLNRLRLADRFYSQAVGIKEDTNLHVLHGIVLYELKRNDEAEGRFRKALDLDPHNEEAHWNLGCVYKGRGKVDAAEKHLRRAIEIDPKLARAYAELGHLLVGQKDRFKEATSVLRRAVKYNFDDGWSMAYLAYALWRLRRLKEADEQYRRLIELWPNEALPYWCYGDFLASERKNRSTAEWYLRKAVEIEPNQSANYFLGKHLVRWDQQKEAKKFLTKSSRQGHVKAREWLRWIREHDEK
jgi:protein O-mannosyl-transferase